jgi:hypothetical protein
LASTPRFLDLIIPTTFACSLAVCATNKAWHPIPSFLTIRTISNQIIRIKKTAKIKKQQFIVIYCNLCTCRKKFYGTKFEFKGQKVVQALAVLFAKHTP